MISNAGMWHRRDLWTEVVSTTTFIVNRSPRSSIEFKIPEEVWSGITIDYSFLKVFGCTAYAHINDGKLAHIAVKCILKGYSSESKGYRLWYLESKKVILSRDVTFNKKVMIKSFGSEHSISSPNQVDRDRVGEKVELETSSQSPMVDINSSSGSHSCHDVNFDDDIPHHDNAPVTSESGQP